MNNNDYNEQNNMNNQNVYSYYVEPNNQKEIPYNTVSQSYYYQYYNDGKKKKKSHMKIIIPIIFVLVLLSSFLIYKVAFNNSNKKDRTFMIYMVGSDLESKSKQGTFSISDIVGENIDLDNNNILLMVGGAEKWHNFVEADEIGIYELTSEGFKKTKKMPIESMGSSNTLEKFLYYSYKEYPADNYDMIFWNHGLGAIGIEQDELSKDFLTISELNSAFKNSPFNNKKLELTIFYNCLASNIHIANIMKDYSNYMVASEEVFYLSKVLNRLNFLENVAPDDTAYDIGYLFVEQSDKVVKEYNDSHTKKIDSTLAILDLTKIDSLNTKLNEFIKKIDIQKNYYDISSFRRKTHTYGITQTYDYDTIDLYEMVESLGKITNNQEEAKKVQNEIENVVKYTSNLNDYSNGISIYFPYFGKTSSIETHLALFSKIFNDNYYSFINDFYQVRTGVKRARGSISKLTNTIYKNEDGSLSLDLTDEEKKNFQSANIYIYRKVDDNYNLILQSNKVKIDGNRLVFNNNKKMIINGNTVSYINNDDYNLVYGELSDKKDTLNVKYTIKDNKINEVILDSNEYISSSLIDYDDYSEVYFSTLKYKLYENDLFNEDFGESYEKEKTKIDKNNINITYEDINEEYYVLIEMKDIYNESFISNVDVINSLVE